MELWIAIAALAGLGVGAGAALFFARGRGDEGAAAREAIFRDKLVEAEALERDLRQRLDAATRAQSAAEALAKRIAPLEDDLARVQEGFSEMRAKAARLEAELKAEREQAAEKQALLQSAEKKLADTFDALSAKTLQATTAQFLELAKASFASEQEASKGDLEKRQQAIDGLVAPVREALEKMGLRLGEIEQARAQSYGALTKQVESLGERSDRLSLAATNLASALKNPAVRGKWGENTLRRSFELAGLNSHIDFDEQSHVAHEGETFRPDAIVRLPGGRAIVVDAKAPADAYFRAHDTADADEKRRHLEDHARQLRGHVRTLSAKGYGAKVEGSPEFVLLFLPNEGLLSAAVEADPGLLEFAAEQRIALATPLVFQAMLWVIAYAWRQEGLAVNAREIEKMGADLYDRISVLAKHIGAIGSALDDATNAYNKSVASLENRLLPTARKFKELEAVPANAPAIEMKQVEVSSKPFTKAELRDAEPKLLG